MKHHRFEVLDGLRGVAAISVMLYHFCQRMPLHPFMHADLAVDLFFVLSGFVLCYSYAEKLKQGLPVTTYVAKRLIRLYPMFAIAVLLGALTLFGLYKASTTGFSLEDILKSIGTNLLMLPFFNDVPIESARSGTAGKFFPGNNPLWSIFFEMVASLSLIVLCRFKIKPLLIFTAVCFLAYVCHGIYLTIHNDANYLMFDAGFSTRNFLGGFPKVLYGFALGMCIFMGLESIRQNKIILFWEKLPHHLLLLSIVAVAVFAFPFWVKGLYKFAAIATALPVIVILGAVSVNATAKQISICKFLGDISFPLYCLHIPVQRLCYTAFDNYAPAFSYGVVPVITATVISVGLSYLILKLYDEPIRKALSERLSRRDTSAPATV